MFKKLIPTLSIIFLGVLIGGFIVYSFMPKWDSVLETKETMDSEVLLEKIHKVYKLVVVEGEFADILNYQNYYGFDLPGFRKKALIKVKAKVSVGYDLENLKIEFDQTRKVVLIKNLPEPEILAIDTDISYFDLDDGFFNNFTETELTKLNRAAKDTIRSAALRSSMMQTARGQAFEMLGTLALLVETEGWKIESADGIKPIELDFNFEDEPLFIDKEL